MNKFFSLFALLILGMVFLPACSETDSDKGKPLIVACEAATSPYCYYRGPDKTPAVAGIDVDLIETLGKELGRPVKYKIVPFQQIFSLVAAGKADIGAAGITITEQRAERVLFSTIYDVSSQVVVVPKNSSITDAAAMKSARVAAQEGTSDLTLLRDLQSAECAEVERRIVIGIERSLDLLQTGDASESVGQDFSAECRSKKDCL